MRIVGYEVIEFHGTGDPWFGGSADDRPLGASGQFLSGVYSWGEVARFSTAAEASAAAEAAPKRKGGRVAVILIRDYSLE
jgi:hypothetical protein